MNLPPRTLGLVKTSIKEQPALALDTGFEADSMEGLRLVKASRGSGWFYHAGTLTPWVTKGVYQDAGRLVVWGDLDVPEGNNAPWPLDGDEGKVFLRALVEAWTAVAARDALGGFTSASVVPWRTTGGWAFTFPPAELRAVLDSLQPVGERLAWDHYRHPDASGPEAWAFTSAALAVRIASGGLPWVQEDEAHLRQELRDLKRTFSVEELPEGPDPATLALWADSLTMRLGNGAATGWKAWASQNPAWNGNTLDPARAAKRAQAAKRRELRRTGAAFWRRKGTVVTAAAATAAVLLSIVGSVVWNQLKPDPTDHWTPEQVVRGYYAAYEALDQEIMRKLTRFDGSKEKPLDEDQNEATNLYVIRQVRTAYEHQSPVVAATDWEAAGRPELTGSQMLWGLTELTLEGSGEHWTVRYNKWTAEGGTDGKAAAAGTALVDTLTLDETPRGWKIVSLQRHRSPLP